MKDDQAIQTNYNCQLAVDNKTKLILSSKVITSPADTTGLRAQVGTIEETFKGKPKELLADSGYYSIDNVSYLEDKHIKGYIPHQDDARNIKDIFNGKENLFDKKFFKYNRLKDRYACPQGKILPKKTIHSKRGLTLYKATDCPECTKQKLCLRGKAKFRHIARYTTMEDIIIKMRNRLFTRTGKAKYAQRAPTAETPFAHFKKNLGFRQFLCRGLPCVSTEFKLLCIGYNLRKIAPFICDSRRKIRFISALN